AVLDLLHDPVPAVALVVQPLAHRAVDLRREHDRVAPALQRLADDLLGPALAVDVGRVNEVDLGVDGVAHHADALVLVRVAPRTEHHRAQAVRADLDPRASERAVLHREPPEGVAAPTVPAPSLERACGPGSRVQSGTIPAPGRGDRWSCSWAAGSGIAVAIPTDVPAVVEHRSAGFVTSAVVIRA